MNKRIIKIHSNYLNLSHSTELFTIRFPYRPIRCHRSRSERFDTPGPLQILRGRLEIALPRREEDHQRDPSRERFRGQGGHDFRPVRHRHLRRQEVGHSGCRQRQVDV